MSVPPSLGRRAFVQAGFGGLALTGLALTGLTLPARGQSTTGVLRYGLSTYPPNLQPWARTGASSATIKTLIHRSLVTYDSKGQLRGELAESWSLDGDGAWVFKLRQGTLFHNGEPVTADDVKWSIEQIASEQSTAYMRGAFQLIKSVEIPDPHTIRLVTTTPLVPLPSWFANQNVSVIWRKSPPNEPVGAGPFQVTAQERGTSVTLTAFDRYYKPGFPKLKGINFIVYADESLRTTALLNGDVDMIEYVPWQSMETVEKAPNLTLSAAEGPFMGLLFNASKPPLADPRVRRAIAHAVNREDIVKAVFYGRGKPLEGLPIVEGTPWFDKDLSTGWKYDPARAKAMLAEAGYGSGFQLTILSNSQYTMEKDTAEIVQQSLSAVGIQCELKLPDWSTRVTMGTRGQYDLAINGTSADSNDPDGLSQLLDTTLPASYARSFALQAPRTGAALAKGRAEFDQAKRVAIYKDMQRAALEEVPFVALNWRSQGFGLSQHVKGFAVLAGGLSGASTDSLEETYFG
jgi:peptide/nickel transport system substrate-binding protein